MNTGLNRHYIIEPTLDGSDTLFVPDLNEHYHSVNGAVQEAMHVFIDAGLSQKKSSPLYIIEVGFGTGLNAFLTLRHAISTGQTIFYTALELYPLDDEVVEQLNYTDAFSIEEKAFFIRMHSAEWDNWAEIAPNFHLLKLHTDFSKLDSVLDQSFDLVYFDAFAPEKQPEMWTQAIFDFLYKHTNTEGILTTYCAKGVVRRSMQEAGYMVERLPGPPGKREMLRASKK